MDEILSNIVKTTKSYDNDFKKIFLKIDQTKTYKGLRLLMKKNLEEFYCYLDLGLNQKDLEKKYIYLAIFCYSLYNTFLYVKEEHLNNLIINKKQIKDLMDLSQNYISPLTYINYMCFNSSNKNLQKKLYKLFLSTEEYYVSPKKIDLRININIKNKELYSLYVTLDKMQNTLYRIHELILSPELDELESILTKKYNKNVKDLKKYLVRKYGLKRLRCK